MLSIGERTREMGSEPSISKKSIIISIMTELVLASRERERERNISRISEIRYKETQQHFQRKIIANIHIDLWSLRCF